jgi:hypothetical protein
MELVFMATHIGIFLTVAMAGTFQVSVHLEVSEGAEFNPPGTKEVVIITLVVVAVAVDRHPMEMWDGHLQVRNGNIDGMRLKTERSCRQCHLVTL